MNTNPYVQKVWNFRDTMRQCIRVESDASVKAPKRSDRKPSEAA